MIFTTIHHWVSLQVGDNESVIKPEDIQQFSRTPNTISLTRKDGYSILINIKSDTVVVNGTTYLPNHGTTLYGALLNLFSSLIISSSGSVEETDPVWTAEKGDYLTTTDATATYQPKGTYLTSSGSAALTNKTGNISQWTNDTGYLTTANLSNYVLQTRTINSKPLSADISLTTTDIAEGSNLYYTSGRFNSAFGAKTTDDLTEGSAHVYFTNTRWDTRLATKTTTNLAEGSNLYFTNTRVQTYGDAHYYPLSTNPVGYLTPSSLPTLQGVTTVGNTTSDDINVNRIGLYDGAWDAYNYMSVEDGFWYLDGSNSGYGNVYFGLPGGNYAYGLPEGSGTVTVGVKVNGVTYPTHTSGIADLGTISPSEGGLLSRMTKIQRDAISSPATGLLIYQTDNTPGLRCYNGVNWIRYTENID